MNDIGLSIEDGEIFGVIGLSGAASKDASTCGMQEICQIRKQGGLFTGPGRITVFQDIKTTLWTGK